MPVFKHRLLYWLIRCAVWPFQWISYAWIHRVGNLLGLFLFHWMKKYRKRALSNLALASDLPLSNQERIQVAKASFQNLAIVCLEYARLSVDRILSPKIFCENPEIADELHRQGQGVIFFCAHLSNWEVLFLEGTQRMKGIAIGKPIKNRPLYQWILRIREQYGGKIVGQRSALIEGLRALKKGWFLGIVGDQGMPSSGYSSRFLGRVAWTSSAPALLAYRTNSPIIFAETRRTVDGYAIRYSEPLWPDLSQSAEVEVRRLMDLTLGKLETSIKKSPGEWLWQHNRWKQQTPKHVYQKFRHDAIGLILPQEPEALNPLFSHLKNLKKIYPQEFFLIFAPLWAKDKEWIEHDEIIFYQTLRETLRDDYRCKLIFNFTNYRPIRRHYLARSAFEVLDFSALKKLAKLRGIDENSSLSDLLQGVLCRAL